MKKKNMYDERKEAYGTSQRKHCLGTFCFWIQLKMKSSHNFERAIVVL